MTMPAFSSRSVSFSLSAAASIGAADTTKAIPIKSNFLMSEFLLEAELDLSRAGATVIIGRLASPRNARAASIGKFERR
jgi:hypothetical protein